MPSDALRNVLLAMHPGDRPVASLVYKSWLRCHDELVTELAERQAIEVRPAPSTVLSSTEHPLAPSVALDWSCIMRRSQSAFCMSSAEAAAAAT